MVKALLHISRFSKAVLLPGLLSFCTAAGGQEPPPEAIDTVINIEARTDDGINTRFNAVLPEDQQPLSSRRMDTQKADRLKKDEAFWYINTVPERAKKPVLQPRKAPANEPSPLWIRNLLWVLVVGGFVILIIWFLVSSDVQLFRKSPPVVAKQGEEEEFSTENLFDIDYNSALQRAIAAQNYRLAIRLLYLQTLRELALRNLIQFRQERTNSDYLMQLFQTAYYKEFFRLTRNFEYAWYGQFQVSRPAFEQIRDEFLSFNQRIPS